MERCLKVQNLFLNSKLNSTETHGKKDKFSPILQFQILLGPTGVDKSAYHDQLHTNQSIDSSNFKCRFFFSNTHNLLKMDKKFLNLVENAKMLFILLQLAVLYFFEKKNMLNPFSNFYFQIQKQICKKKYKYTTQ